MNNALRSALEEPRAPAPVRVWRDWALVALCMTSSVLEALLRTDLTQRPVNLLLGVGLAPVLLWRRTHPLRVVVIAFGGILAVDVVLLVAGLSQSELVSLVYLLLLPYSLYRWGSGREKVLGTVVIAVPACIGLLVDWTGVGDAIGGTVVLLGSIELGVAVRYRASARRRLVAQAKSDERVLLARELHDTVAHHVSSIAIQAQAGKALLASSPASSAEALDNIEVEASRTLAEMRTIVRMLRSQADVDFSPQPGVAEIEGMAAPNGGPRVLVQLGGDLTGLPEPVDAALYRLAQESVTNALRHARHATEVEVHVTGEASTVTLRVQDDGDTSAGIPAQGPGFGLVGMAERAALLGGSCRAGPRPGGGWTVDAVIPRVIAE